MNPLKEWAYLFVNGQFKIRFKDLEENWKMDEVEDFEPSLLQVIQDSKDEFLSIDQCALIARPIEDMTDEELANHLAKNSKPSEYSNGTLKDWMITLIDLANNGEMYRDDFVNLLSIGVLPFPQTLFEDRTVIDSREVS